MTSIDKLRELGVQLDANGTGPVETTVTVESVDQLRWLMDLGLDDEARAEHYDALFGASGTGEGVADELVRNVAAYAVGDAPLTRSTRRAVAPAFPLTLNVLAEPGPITVTGKQDLSRTDGRPTLAVFTDVTMKPGGYFYCAGTTLTFTCDTFTRADPIGGDNDFAIVGVTGTTPGKPATPGQAGKAGSGGPGNCSSGGIAGPGGGNGTKGDEGTKGTPGSTGGAGTPSQPTTIWIKKSLNAPQLVVYTQSGIGGTGGPGGDGGLGQPGGNGGNGVDCGCTGNAGGSGAAGGRGGKGGRGGDGGEGTDAVGNITVFVPTGADIGKVADYAQGAPPGQPGTPGTGGDGGAGGTGGSKGKHNDAGSDAGKGGQGDPGDQGNAGTHTGQPAQVVTMVHP